LERQEPVVVPDQLGNLENEEIPDTQVPEEKKDHVVQSDQSEKMVPQEPQDPKDHQDHQVCLVPQV